MLPVNLQAACFLHKSFGIKYSAMRISGRPSCRRRMLFLQAITTAFKWAFD